MPNEFTTDKKLLERIFELTEDLYNEMSVKKEGIDSTHNRIYHLLADLGQALSGADRCSFWRWDKRRKKLITNAAVGVDVIEIDEGTGLVGMSIEQGEPLVTNDPYSHPMFNSSVDKATGYVTKSILVMPIRSCRGDIVGAYQAINKLDEGGFDVERDCRRLSLAAMICGLTLESDVFLDESHHDKLTQVKNRMGFYSDWSAIYAPILEDPDNVVPIGIIMCDIDHFKHVNDTYGHNAGDAVLSFVSKMLTGSIRSTDNCYRWGGEEFILILPQANLEAAARVAERIRTKIEKATCTFEGTDIKVTMSFGVSTLTAELSAEDNIKVADGRLYTAKETGRNKVVAEDQ